MMEISRTTWKGIAAVIGGVCIHITLGNGYSFGNVMSYSASYMQSRVSTDVTYSNFMWVNSVSAAAQGALMFFSGLLASATGPKFTCLFGSTVFCSGVLLTYYTINYSLITVALTYGFLVGFGSSLVYPTPLSCGTTWFPRRKGLINGIIVGGYGLGALFTTFIQTFYLNPNNLSPESNGYFTDNEILDKVPSMFFLLGGVLLILDYIGCILISRPQFEKKDDEISIIKEREAGCDKTDTVKSVVTDLGPKEMLRVRLFYILWTMYMFLAVGANYINAMYKVFGQMFIKDDHFLSMVGSLAAIFNASGRILWGRIMDKTSFKTALRLMSTLYALLMATLPLTKYMGKPGFAIWVWSIFLTFSGSFSLMPTAILKAFGAKNFISNYGATCTCLAVASIVSATINQLMLEAIGFTGCFEIMAGIIIASAALTFFIPDGL